MHSDFCVAGVVDMNDENNADVVVVEILFPQFSWLKIHFHIALADAWNASNVIYPVIWFICTLLRLIEWKFVIKNLSIRSTQNLPDSSFSTTDKSFFKFNNYICMNACDEQMCLILVRESGRYKYTTQANR